MVLNYRELWLAPNQAGISSVAPVILWQFIGDTMRYAQASAPLLLLNIIIFFLIRTTFNWSRLTGSEVQSIIKAGAWQNPGRHGAGRAQSSIV